MKRSYLIVGLIFLIFFVISFLTNILGPLVPDIINSFSLSLTLAGFLPFSFFIAYGWISIPAGMLVERYKEKRVMLAAFLMALVGALLFGTLPRFSVAMVSLFLIGTGMAMLQVAINPLLRVAGGEKHFAFNSVFAQLIFGLASYLSPKVYSYLVLNLPRASGRKNLTLDLLRKAVPDALPWVSLYWVFSLVTLAMVAVIALVRLPKVELKEEERAGAWSVYRGLLRKKMVILFFLGLFAYVGTEQGVANWISKFLALYHGIDPQTRGASVVSLFWGLLTAGCVLGMVMLKLFDSRRVLVGFAAAAIVTLTCGLFGSASTAVIAFPLVGFFISVMWSIIFSLALNSLDRHHGSFSGILVTGVIGGALVPLFIGWLGDRFGLRYGMTFLYVTLGYILSIGIWARPLIANATISWRKKKTAGAALAVFIVLLFGGLAVPSRAAAPAAPPDEGSIRKALVSRYSGLLTEKGLCDEEGQEIDGRVGRAIADARAKGLKRDKEILDSILAGLNYQPSNLGNFPECAFDRPFGDKLAWFGRTVAPADIDATAEGSACPAGGIGAGSFEWTISGNFRYWFLKSGWLVDDTLWANQFHVFMRQGKRTVTQTLSADAPPSTALQSWKWKYPQGKGSYYALYPKSGFSYERNADLPVALAVTQFSPVIPHNYRETSYPVAIYRWTAENRSSRPAEVSVMLTWENMIGWEPVSRAKPSDFRWDRRSAGNFNEFVRDGLKKGIVFKRKGLDIRIGNAMSGSMAIAAIEVPGKLAVSYDADFDPEGDGREVWTAFAADGTLPDDAKTRVVSGKEATAGAIAVKLRLGPHERYEFPVVIAWDLPYYEFEKGVKYLKKYTEFFGAEGDKAFAIAGEALDNYRKWEKAIDDWQNGVIRDRSLPGWLKQALFNELYVLAETSIWDASTGLHTYLESADYLMYGTTDVDSYCWQVLDLWPELELGNARFLAGTVGLEDPSFKIYQYPTVYKNDVPPDKMHYYWSTNKVRGMMPHDLGSPRLRPWVVLNAFDWQNGNVWKDLSPKFPLRAYRDFLATGAKDLDFLARSYEASVLALDTLERRFGDPQTHIPLNEGIPDQTYDTWKMKGQSAYISMLWLAALKATWTMGGRLVENNVGGLDLKAVAETVDRYKAWFAAGRTSLQKLWDEARGYFHIDAATDDVMADQLFGVWYSKMLGLEDDPAELIIPREQAVRALHTIYETNVLGFGHGLMGAVNGRTKDGKQLFSQQADEVWVGTSYALAAADILHGLRGEGMRTAFGVYYVTYSPYGHGYFFKTPEAYCNPEEKQWNNPSSAYGDRVFRAMKYMRPGAVWALAEALKKK